MGFSPDYLYYFHYSDSMGYLIFCCHSVATSSEVLTPRSIDKLSLIECFFAALHNVNNLFVCRIQVNVTLGNINLGFLEFDNQYPFGVTKHRDICIMRGKDKLHIRLFLRNGCNDFIIDYLIIKIIFRLIN